MEPQLVEGIIITPDLEFDENCGGIGNVYYNSMKRYGDRIALINAATEEFYTYNDLLPKCISTALALQKRGFKKQDLIAVCSNKENLNANVPIIAGQFLGIITFSLDPQLSVDECVELLEQVQPMTIFVIEEAKNKITQALKISNAKTEVVSFGMDFEKHFLKECDGMDSFKPVIVNNLKETCIIHFSSGSTGSPKPICLSHYYLLTFQSKNNNEIISEKPFKYYATKPMGPVSLRFANWYWASNSFELMTFVTSGGCRILREKFDPQEIWKFVDKYSITNLLLTPLQCVELSMTTRPQGIDISSVADISTGGYTLHKDYLFALRVLFPDTHIHQAYGMTECGIATLFNRKISKHLQLLAKKPNSCGLPVSGLHYKMEKFIIVKDYMKNCEGFGTTSRKVEFKLKPIPNNIEPVNWLKEAITQIVLKSTESLEPADMVGFTFCSRNLERGKGWLRFQEASKVTVEEVWGVLNGIFQSNSSGIDTDTFCLEVTRVRLPKKKHGK